MSEETTIPAPPSIPRMLAHIDAKAGTVRARFITVAAGQTATYIMKQDQAAAFIQAGYPSNAIPPLVASEASATGEPPQTAANRIMGEAQAWAGLAGVIETIRRTTKVAVINAPSIEAAQAAYQAGVDQLASIP